MQGCIAAGVINPVKILTDYNLVDFLTKALAWKELHYHGGVFYARWELGSNTDIQSVKLKQVRVNGKRKRGRKG